MSNLWIPGKRRELVSVIYSTSHGNVTEEKPVSEIKNKKHELAHAHFLERIIKGVTISKPFQTKSFYLNEKFECYNDAEIQRVMLELRDDGTLRTYGLEGTLSDSRRAQRGLNPLKQVREYFLFMNSSPFGFQGNSIPQNIWPRDIPTSINDSIEESILDFCELHPNFDLISCLGYLKNPGEGYDAEKIKDKFFIL